MPSAYFNLHYHLVFATKGRKRWLDDTVAPRIHQFLGGAIRGVGGTAVIVNGMADHVHILASLRPDKSLSDVMRTIKAGSSGWIHETFPDLRGFAWQAGYGAFTVSQSQIEEVQKYILHQAIHHRSSTFEEEFVRLLQAHGVTFNQAYLWD